MVLFYNIYLDFIFEDLYFDKSIIANKVVYLKLVNSFDY